MDLAFTKNSDQKTWLEEARFIQDNLDENTIRKAFENLPKEVQDKTSEDLIRKLLIRKNDLQIYAKDYYKFLNKRVLLLGTNKKDKFLITRLPSGETEVKIYRSKKVGEELISTQLYSKKRTKEIWIYGLSDDDVFVTQGNERNNIRVRMFGGLDNDDYQIENGNRIHIYDYATKKNN